MPRSSSAASWLCSLLLVGCGAPEAQPVKPPVVAPAPIKQPEVAFTTAPGTPKGIPVDAIKYRRTIVREAEYYWGLDAPTATFFAQMHQESNFRSTAKSKYASGLAQFTPQTAAGMQQAYPDLRVLCPIVEGCPLDASWAIKAMVLYDRGLWKGRADTDSESRIAFMLADYNGGAGWINRERAACKADAVCQSAKYFGHVEAFCGQSLPGVPRRAAWACDENRHYPSVILFKWLPLYIPWLKT